MGLLGMAGQAQCTATEFTSIRDAQESLAVKIMRVVATGTLHIGSAHLFIIGCLSSCEKKEIGFLTAYPSPFHPPNSSVAGAAVCGGTEFFKIERGIGHRFGRPAAAERHADRMMAFQKKAAVGFGAVDAV